MTFRNISLQLRSSRKIGRQAVGGQYSLTGTRTRLLLAAFMILTVVISAAADTDWGVEWSTRVPLSDQRSVLQSFGYGCGAFVSISGAVVGAEIGVSPSLIPKAGYDSSGNLVDPGSAVVARFSAQPKVYLVGSEARARPWLSIVGNYYVPLFATPPSLRLELIELGGGIGVEVPISDSFKVGINGGVLPIVYDWKSSAGPSFAVGLGAGYVSLRVVLF